MNSLVAYSDSESDQSDSEDNVGQRDDGYGDGEGSGGGLSHKRALEEGSEGDEELVHEVKRQAIETPPKPPVVATKGSSSHSLFSMLPPPKKAGAVEPQPTTTVSNTTVPKQNKTRESEYVELKQNIEEDDNENLNNSKVNEIIHNSLIPGALRKKLMKKAAASKKTIVNTKQIQQPVQKNNTEEEEEEESYNIKPPVANQEVNDDDAGDSYDLIRPVENEDEDEEDTSYDIQAPNNNLDKIFKESQYLDRYKAQASGMVTVNQSNLINNDPHSHLASVGQAIQSSGPRVSANLRQKHQISSLLADYENTKVRFEEQKIAIAQKKAKKY